MVPDQSKACVGLEYFCFEGDDLWDDGRRRPRRARQARARAARPRAGRRRSSAASSCASRRPTRCTTPTTPSASTSIRGWLDGIDEPPAGRPQRPAPLQQLRPLDADRDPRGRQHPARHAATTSGRSTPSRAYHEEQTERSRSSPYRRASRRRRRCSEPLASEVALSAEPRAGRSPLQLAVSACSRSRRSSGGRRASTLPPAARAGAAACRARRRRSRCTRSPRSCAASAGCACSPTRARALARRRLRADDRRLHGQQRAPGARGRRHEGAADRAPHGRGRRATRSASLVAERMLDAAALGARLRRARHDAATSRSASPAGRCGSSPAACSSHSPPRSCSAAAPPPGSDCGRSSPRCSPRRGGCGAAAASRCWRSRWPSGSSRAASTRCSAMSPACTSRCSTACT